jgi:hypothetical protein
MAKVYQEVNDEGSIEVGYPFTRFDPKVNFDHALSLLSNLEFTSHEISRQYYNYIFTVNRITTTCNIYLFVVEGPGRGGGDEGADASEVSAERRIQWFERVPFTGITQYKNGLVNGSLLNKECYVIAVYRRQDSPEYVFAAFHPENINTSPRSFPVSTQFKIGNIAEAKTNGYSQFQKTNGEIVFIFKPEYLISYMANRDQLHKKVLDEILKPSGAIIKPTDYPHNLIYFGAPGTGKSNTIDSYTTDNNSVKITFHPDTDYGVFVGSYKPIQTSEGTGITYGFVAQSFLQAYTKAWETEEETFLIIEEINRGNCAQIFGDIFQIIERGENGYSKYKIDADAEIEKYLKAHYDNLVAAGGAEATKAERYNAYFGGNFKKIALPNNLFIHATMNTSDQSLFPIDSAFKRRWDWEYIPIMFDGTEADSYQIKIDNDNYSWRSFIEIVNEKIKSITESEDKKLGQFFIKSFNNSISEKTFKAKVLFFIWNDILKDEPQADTSYFFRRKANFEDATSTPFMFSDLFSTDSTQLLKDFMKYLGIEVTAE